MVSSDATLPDAKSLDTDADSMPVLETDPPLGSFGRRKPSLRERMNECTLKGAPFWVVFGA